MARVPLSLLEREEISRALIENPVVPWAVVGRRIARCPATVSREVARHGGRDRYRSAVAQAAAVLARRRPRRRLLAVEGPVRDRVIAKLGQGRSPEAIWADMHAEQPRWSCPTRDDLPALRDEVWVGVMSGPGQ